LEQKPKVQEQQKPANVVVWIRKLLADPDITFDENRMFSTYEGETFNYKLIHRFINL
jgi:hypothetical protein